MQYGGTEVPMVMNRGAINEWTTFLESLRNELETARARFVEAESQVARLEFQVHATEDSIAALSSSDIPPARSIPASSLFFFASTLGTGSGLFTMTMNFLGVNHATYGAFSFDCLWMIPAIRPAAGAALRVLSFALPLSPTPQAFMGN